MKALKRTVIVLVCLVGLWAILLALRKPWIEPIPGVRLEPTRPILLEKDIKPGSAFDLLRRAGVAYKVYGQDVMQAQAELKLAPWSLDGATNTLTVLEKAETSLALARSAGEASDPQVPTITSFDQEMPFVGTTRAISRCFIVSAKAKTARGDYSGAFAELRSTIGFSSILTRGGMSVEHDSSTYCCNSSCKTMRQIALNYPVQDDLLRDMMRFLEHTENGLEPWAECVRHERICLRSRIDEFFKNPPSLPIRIVVLLLGSTPNVVKKDMNAYYAHIISMAEKPYDEAAYDRFHELLMPSSPSARREMSILLKSRDPVGRSFAFSMGSGQYAHSRYVFRIADLRATRIVLAVVMFKRDEGRLPQTLDELVPKYLPSVPEDPFDRKPMKYRLDEDGSWVVYSVGSDGKDDGGIQDQDKWGHPDLIFGPKEGV